MLSKVISSAVLGIDAYPVEVEVDIASRGLPFFSTVGLPDAAVKESKERVRAALKNTGFDFPLKQVVVNLAPADIKKEGSAFDLPIAIGMLIAEGVLTQEHGERLPDRGRAFAGRPRQAGARSAVHGRARKEDRDTAAW